MPKSQLILKSPSSSLLVPYKQVSKSDLSYELPDSVHTFEHQYINILCTHCGHNFFVPIYCGNRFCQICSVKRQSRVRRRLKWLTSQVEPPRGYGFKHLTLTISNMPTLDDMVKKLTKSFRRMRQRAYWKNNVIGGAFVIEITGHPGDWHAHIHAIIEARWMNYDRLKAIWIACSGSTGIYITRLSKNKVVNYLTKYLTKSGVSEELQMCMSDALKSARLFNPFGKWYAMNCLYRQPKPGCPACDDADLILCSLAYYDTYDGTVTRYT